jgi:CCR4-NOT transcription complex subunit 7/8
LALKGINCDIFGEYLMTSGLILNEDIHWVSFHGVYDFAYLLKVVTNLTLPESESTFFENLKLYFPHYYDIRHLVRYTENFRGSLSKLGQELNIGRIGTQHQAGSDSIITSEIFFKLKQEYFSDDSIQLDKNILFGMTLTPEEEGNYYSGFNFNTQGNSKWTASTTTNNNNFVSNGGYEYNNNQNYYPMNMQYPYMRNPTPGSYFPNNLNSLNNNLNNINNVNSYQFTPYSANGMNQMNYNFQNMQMQNNLTNEEKRKYMGSKGLED